MSCNGIKVWALNAACQRVAVKSSIQSSFFLKAGAGFLRSRRGKPVEVGFQKDELIVIAAQDNSERPTLEIEPLGDAAGTIICQSSRYATKVLRVGTSYRYQLEGGESLVLRSSRIHHPTHGGPQGLTV